MDDSAVASFFEGLKDLKAAKERLITENNRLQQKLKDKDLQHEHELKQQLREKDVRIGELQQLLQNKDAKHDHLRKSFVKISQDFTRAMDSEAGCEVQPHRVTDIATTNDEAISASSNSAKRVKSALPVVEPLKTSTSKAPILQTSNSKASTLTTSNTKTSTPKQSTPETSTPDSSRPEKELANLKRAIQALPWMTADDDPRDVLPFEQQPRAVKKGSMQTQGATAHKDGDQARAELQEWSMCFTVKLRQLLVTAQPQSRDDFHASVKDVVDRRCADQPNFKLKVRELASRDLICLLNNHQLNTHLKAPAPAPPAPAVLAPTAAMYALRDKQLPEGPIALNDSRKRRLSPDDEKPETAPVSRKRKQDHLSKFLEGSLASNVDAEADQAM